MPALRHSNAASRQSRLAAVSDLDGRPVTVDLGSDWLDGTAAGISEQGLLLLDTAAGRVALAVGEVVAVRDAPGRSADQRRGERMTRERSRPAEGRHRRS